MDDSRPAAPPGAASLLAAITLRRERLRTYGRWLCRAAVVLFALWLTIGAPDPAGRDLFGDSTQSAYAAVPAELYAHLEKAGVAVRLYPAGWGKHGVTSPSGYGVLILTMLALHLAIRRMFVRLDERLTLFAATPVVGFIVYSQIAGMVDHPPALGNALVLAGLGGGAYWLSSRLISAKVGRAVLATMIPIAALLGWQATIRLLTEDRPNARATVARAGVVVDEPRSTVVPPDGTGSTDPDEPTGWVGSRYLDPDQLPQPLADQGHYLLAQQAYMENDPARSARHLRALTGRWAPQDWHTRGRIGALAAWSAARGERPGAVAARVAGGAPYIGPRRIAATLFLWLGCLLGTAGLWCVHLAQRLRDRWERPASGPVVGPTGENAPTSARDGAGAAL